MEDYIQRSTILLSPPPTPPPPPLFSLPPPCPPLTSAQTAFSPSLRQKIMSIYGLSQSFC